MGRPKTLLLWCMSTVVFMLENDNRLPSLEQPAFAFKRTGGIADTSSYGEKTNSVNVRGNGRKTAILSIIMGDSCQPKNWTLMDKPHLHLPSMIAATSASTSRRSTSTYLVNKAVVGNELEIEKETMKC
ncbi:hypothetical protein CRG98_021081 [Punica granatum]|uniref:Uncharacterized protein n=1 Tax=Punica granatum TaxID=22663 RepID=A0A2I0JRK1_PUNGR|nr:hypothetical protein CRG98_021081 [Punica granatum]